MAKRAGFIVCLVVSDLGVGASRAQADPPPAVSAADVQAGSVQVSGPPAAEWLYNRVRVGTPVFSIPS